MMDRLGFACDCRVCLNRWFMDLNWWVGLNRWFMGLVDRFELVVYGFKLVG